jgi:hypothetical protein
VRYPMAERRDTPPRNFGMAVHQSFGKGAHLLPECDELEENRVADTRSSIRRRGASGRQRSVIS